MNDSRSDDQLRALLRDADPADNDRVPTEEEHAALRRLVLNRIPDRNPSWKWLPIATATAALLVAAALLIGPYRTRPATDLGAPDRPTTASSFRIYSGRSSSPPKRVPASSGCSTPT